MNIRGEISMKLPGVMLAAASQCIAALFIVPTYTKADDMVGIYMTGEQLTHDCRAFLEFRRQGGRASAQQGFDSAMCLAFVEGVHDAEILGVSPSQLAPAACVPRGSNANSLAEIVANFADQNPALRGSAGYVLVKRALAQSFPCRQ